MRRLQLSPAPDQVFVKVLSYYMARNRSCAHSYQEIVPRSCTLEEIRSPERYLGLRRDDGPVPSRLRPSI